MSPLTERTRSLRLDGRRGNRASLQDGPEEEVNGTPLRVAWRSSVWRTRITDAEVRLLARVIQTQMTLEAQVAAATRCRLGNYADRVQFPRVEREIRDS
jgi:hypothetical protein